MSEGVYKDSILEVEPYGIDPIPRQERHGKVSKLFTLWFASDLNVVTWFTGFIGIEFGLSLKYSILAIVIGNLLGGVFLAFASALGPALGQPLVPGSKRAFGKAGVVGLSFLNLLNNVGWLAVNLVLSVLAFQQIFPRLGYHPALIILALATMVIAVYGYNFIHAFAYWSTIIMGVIFVVMTAISVHNLPLVMGNQTAASGGFNWGMFILAIAIAFSYQISYTPIGSDYSRYLPERTPVGKAWGATYLGCVFVTIWLEVLGSLTATLGLHAGPMEFFARLMGFFTIPAMISVILSLMPINVMAVYSAGLAVLAMGFPLKRWTAALITGGLAVLAVFFGSGALADTYKNFLLLLSYWIAPWLGVLVADFLYHGIGPVAEENAGWAGILAFLCGVAVSVPFMSSALYTGSLAKYLGGADISYFVSMLVSGLIYLAAVRYQKGAVAVKAPVGLAAKE